MAYRKSETSDDAYSKEERWNCDRCYTDKIVLKEILIPTEKTKRNIEAEPVREQ
jgi:hypothetical protein